MATTGPDTRRATGDDSREEIEQSDDKGATGVIDVDEGDSSLTDYHSLTDDSSH
jgi:hypothetical protein